MKARTIWHRMTKTRRRKILTVVGAGFALIVIIGAASGGRITTPPTAAPPPRTDTVTPTPAPHTVTVTRTVYKTLVPTTCSVYEMTDPFSFVVTGLRAGTTCDRLRKTWNAHNPSSLANPPFLVRNGTYRQYGASETYDADIGPLQGTVFDGGMQRIGQDVCKALVVHGWTVS